MKLIDVLKAHDVDMEVTDDGIVTDFLVLAKVQRMNGLTTVVHAKSVGTDWVTALGLITAAQSIMVQLEEHEEPDE